MSRSATQSGMAEENTDRRQRDADPPRERLARQPMLFRLFERFYVRRYLKRHFRAVRLAGGVPEPGRRAAVVYLNHPAWWDPLLGMFLARHLWPERRHHAPIDAAMLEKYRFFERLGFFGVEQGTRRGAAQFLRASEAILREPNAMLWITAQGSFRDPRQRPVELAPGIGHLAARCDDVAFVPLAVEYPFWQERDPEALLRFGEPAVSGEAVAAGSGQWIDLLAGRLEASQDALAERAIARDAEAFELLLSGRTGIGGVYDLWRRLRAWLGGRRFDPSHAGEERT